MTNAKRDNNGVPIISATSNADGLTPLSSLANPVTHRIKVNDDTTGSNNSSDHNARRDGNSITTIMAVSSVDGITPVAIYIDSITNLLLIKSN